MDPILITTKGTIVTGFRLALLEGRQEIHCIEYPFSKEDALQFIIRHHQPGVEGMRLSAFARR